MNGVLADIEFTPLFCGFKKETAQQT